jgi:hypothetical protein
MQETHRSKPTLRRTEVSPRVLAVYEELKDILRNEEAWAILQRFEDDVRQATLEANVTATLCEPNCDCHFDGDALIVCDVHSLQIAAVDSSA